MNIQVFDTAICIHILAILKLNLSAVYQSHIYIRLQAVT